MQFRGQWLRLNPEQRSCLPLRELPGREKPRARRRLAGTRVWSVPSKFRVCIGPLTYRQFQEFMPTGSGLKRLCQLTRLFVGKEFDFDVQVVLLAAEVPWCQLSGLPSVCDLPGWNSWSPLSFRNDVGDAVFILKEV